MTTTFITTFLYLFIIVAVIVALSLIGLSITILIKRNGKFPNTHLSGNKKMREKGISCVRSMDKQDRENYVPIEDK